MIKEEDGRKYVVNDFFFFFFCQIRMSELDPSDNEVSLKVLRVSMIILKKALNVFKRECMVYNLFYILP